MDVTFPAMRGSMGSRVYYTAMVPLKVVPRLFTFRDYSDMPPEQRAQRVLQETRVPDITRYMLDNEDDYLFSAVTVSYDGEPAFRPLTEDEQIGLLTLPLDTNFVINDGQHRCRAIQEAVSQNPALGDHTISVVMFPMETLDRMQQMFSDLNRTVHKTSRSLDILYDHRDPLNHIALAVAEGARIFHGLVDKDRVSLPKKSNKLFTLSAVYDANRQLLTDAECQNEQQATAIAIEWWDEVAQHVPGWLDVRYGRMHAMEFRSEYLHGNSVVLWALGNLGRKLRASYGARWREPLPGLADIDWRRTSADWDGVCVLDGNVVNRRQTREASAEFLEGRVLLGSAASA